MIKIDQSFEINNVRYDMTFYALSFFFGVMFASIILPCMSIMLGSFLLSLAVLFLNRKKAADLKAAFMLVIFILGMIDYTLAFGISSKLDTLDGETAVYECLIIDNPVEKGSYMQYTARSLFTIKEGKRYNFNEKVFLRINKETVFEFGDMISMEGECSDITGIRNPGDFNYKLYYKSKGICKIIKASDAVLIKKNSAGILRTMLHMSGEKVRSSINEALPEKEAAILTGIITGDKTDIDEDTRDAYMRTGLSHILSVSGLHAGFLMILLTYVLKPLKLGKKLQGFIILSVIAYYVLLIGAPMPSVRALIMLAVMTAGKAAGREYNLAASVSFAGMAMLVFKPMAIHDPGFMISFGAIYSIAFLYQPFYRMLKFIPSAIRGTAALPISVWFGLAPVLAYYFNYVSVIGIIINIIAVPLSFVITISGFIGVFAGMVSKTLSLYIFSVDYYLISLLNCIIQKASSLPASGFNVPTLPAYFYVLYCLGISLWIAYYKTAFFRIYIGKFVLAYLLVVTVALSAYNLPSRNLKMVFFDVGQGDSCCIITPKKKVLLIDGGGSSQRGDYYYDTGRKITLPALLHQGIWKIDTVIVSHLHDDHLEGLLKVMEVYPVKNLILPKACAGNMNISKNSDSLLDLCGKKRVKVYRLGKGDYISPEEGVRMDFLHPGEEANNDENENSLVGMLAYGDFQALLTGDIGNDAERLILFENVRSNVLKVPHHGSGRSSSEEFLMKVKPKVSIISVGKNNFGHPSEDTLKRLSKSGSLVYRTDENGAVTVTTNGKSMKVRTVRRNTLIPETSD